MWILYCLHCIDVYRICIYRLLEVIINNAPVATTEYSPFFLNYGFYPVFQCDITPSESPLPETKRLEPLRKFFERMKSDSLSINKVFDEMKHKAAIQADKLRVDHQFEVGQQVLVSQMRHCRSQLGPTGPLGPKAAGPFTIKKTITHNTFTLCIRGEVLARASPVF